MGPDDRIEGAFQGADRVGGDLCLLGVLAGEKDIHERAEHSEGKQAKTDGQQIKDQVYNQFDPVFGQILQDHGEFLHANVLIEALYAGSDNKISRKFRGKFSSNIAATRGFY